MIRLVIADDHALVRAGFKQLVAATRGIHVVGEAADGEELLRQMAQVAADVIVLDIGMPGGGASFPALLQRLRRDHPAVPVLVVSMHPEGELALGALEAGAAGYVTKSQTPEELIEAVKKVYSGGRYVSPALAERLAEAWSGGKDGNRPALSARELEVLHLLSAGRSNKQIAASLGVSPKTVSTHRTRLLKKLRLRTNADLVRYALQQGLVTL